MNTATIKLGEKEYQLRASNFAAQLYANEFYGRVDGDYNGSLDHDASQVLNDCVGDVDKETGTITIKFTCPALWGIVWALAAAAGSVTVTYDKWMESVRDEIWTASQRAEACVEVVDLMMRTFFRE